MMLKHRLARQRSRAVIISSLVIAPPWPPAVDASPRPLHTPPSSDTKAWLASSCEGSWVRPGYSLTIVQPSKGRFVAAFIPDDAAITPIIGPATWGTIQSSDAIGTIGKASFKAEFPGYGRVELTCTASGPIDQYGRQLVADPEEDLTTTGDMADNAPLQTTPDDDTPSTATDTALPVPYIDEPPATGTIRYQDTPEWQYFRTNSYCYATMAGETGRLLVGYSLRQDHFHLGFWQRRRIAGHPAHSIADVNIITVKRQSTGALGEPKRFGATWQALTLDNSRNNQVFNIKMERVLGLDLMSGPVVISFVDSSGRFLQSFTTSEISTAAHRLVGCRPR